MSDSNWRYNTEVTNGTSNTTPGRCPKHNFPLDDIPTPPRNKKLTKGKIFKGNLKSKESMNPQTLWKKYFHLRKIS